MLRSIAAVALVLGVAACGDDGGDEAASTTTTSTTTTTTTPAPDEVTVVVAGEPVALVLVCSGFDGAVVTEDADGRRVMLVREDGDAIRVGSVDDGFEETSDVERTASPAGEQVRGVVDVDGASLAVELFVPADADLPPCPGGSSSG